VWHENNFNHGDSKWGAACYRLVNVLESSSSVFVTNSRLNASVNKTTDINFILYQIFQVAAHFLPLIFCYLWSLCIKTGLEKQATECLVMVCFSSKIQTLKCYCGIHSYASFQIVFQLAWLLSHSFPGFTNWRKEKLSQGFGISGTDIRLLYCSPQKRFAHVVRDKSNLFMYLVLYLQIYFVIILLIQQWLNMNYNHNWHNHLTVEVWCCELFFWQWILFLVLQIHP